MLFLTLAFLYGEFCAHFIILTLITLSSVITSLSLSDYSFPYMVIILSVISSAAHFAFQLDQVRTVCALYLFIILYGIKKGKIEIRHPQSLKIREKVIISEEKFVYNKIQSVTITV